MKCNVFFYGCTQSSVWDEVFVSRVYIAVNPFLKWIFVLCQHQEISVSTKTSASLCVLPLFVLSWCRSWVTSGTRLLSTLHCGKRACTQKCHTHPSVPSATDSTQLTRTRHMSYKNLDKNNLYKNKVIFLTHLKNLDNYYYFHMKKGNF